MNNMNQSKVAKRMNETALLRVFASYQKRVHSRLVETQGFKLFF
jgi:hypothetical protein